MFFFLWVAFNPPSFLDSASVRVFFFIQLSRPRVVVAVVAEFGCNSYAHFGKEFEGPEAKNQFSSSVFP
jgi:hypothetical protein